jgi:hypothetical protein
MKTRIKDISGIRRRILSFASWADRIPDRWMAAFTFATAVLGLIALAEIDASPAAIAEASPCVRNLVGRAEEVVTRGQLQRFRTLCEQQEAAVGIEREPRP